MRPASAKRKREAAATLTAAASVPSTPTAAASFNLFAQLMMTSERTYPERHMSRIDGHHAHVCSLECEAVRIGVHCMCVDTGILHQCDAHCLIRVTTREHAVCPLSMRIFELEYDASELLFGGHLTRSGKQGFRPDDDSALGSIHSKSIFKPDDDEAEAAERKAWAGGGDATVLSTGNEADPYDPNGFTESKTTTEVAAIEPPSAITVDDHTAQYNARVQTLTTRCARMVWVLTESPQRRAIDMKNWQAINVRTAARILKYSNTQMRLRQPMHVPVIERFMRMRDAEAVAAHIHLPPYKPLPDPTWIPTIVDQCVKFWLRFTDLFAADIKQAQYRFDQHVQATLFALGSGLDRLLTALPGLDAYLPLETDIQQFKLAATTSTAAGAKRAEKPKLSKSAHTFARLLTKYRTYLFRLDKV